MTTSSPCRAGACCRRTLPGPVPASRPDVPAADTIAGLRGDPRRPSRFGRPRTGDTSARRTPVTLSDLLQRVLPGRPGSGPVRAVWNGAVLAESDETIVLEGNHYFPRASVREEH